ncbi:centrosomal of 131 kDa isoform X1 [Pelobates cultripes]|uniref:Centrosomal of 131 kDa isoform X1 n=1 Tax=Pelobates cultripes TaxID=61616 RepID=A0AAD1WE75_PELCU|nr:centrosomal of 131 kDa isoform X1 [Pelobates cultripes]
MEAPSRGSNNGSVRARETSGTSHIGFTTLSGGMISINAYMKQSAASAHIHPAEVPVTSNSNVWTNIMEAPARSSVRVCETSGTSHIGFNTLSGGLSSIVAYMKQSTRGINAQSAEIKALKERLEIEKQAWEQNYMKKEEAWLLSRERELKEDVRKGRDKDIELVIQRLESEMSTAREECERAAENRIKRVRDKYESELQELERSERKLQERCNQLKERATELEGEQIRLQGLLKQREQEVEDIRKITDRLTEERKSLSDVIRQEFADRLVLIEEENRRLKIESSESQARHRLELERINRDKEEELEEVHKRVKTALVKKEETMNSLRKQREAAEKRADHLEALLEQQRKQLLTK